jgi:hypothetical protein
MHLFAHTHLRVSFTGALLREEHYLGAGSLLEINLAVF